jgi:hypothetical protein
MLSADLLLNNFGSSTCSRECASSFEQYVARANYLTNYIRLDGEYFQNDKEVAVGVTNATPDAIAQLKFYKEGETYRPAAEFYATKLEKL